MFDYNKISILFLEIKENYRKNECMSDIRENFMYRGICTDST